MLAEKRLPLSYFELEKEAYICLAVLLFQAVGVLWAIPLSR